MPRFVLSFPGLPTLVGDETRRLSVISNSFMGKLSGASSAPP